MSAELAFNRSVDVDYGVAEDVAPQVRRIVANNPSPYTFLGTNTYIVGRGRVGARRAFVVGRRRPAEGWIVAAVPAEDREPRSGPVVQLDAAVLEGRGARGERRGGEDEGDASDAHAR